MTSRERVLAAFEHREPDRVPLWYGADERATANLQRLVGVPDEEALMRRLSIDFRRVRERYVGPPLEESPDGVRANFWGVKRAGYYYGQPVSHPLAGATTAEEVHSHAWPAPDWFDFSHVPAQCDQWREFAIIGGPWVVVFTDATELMGMEEFFIKITTHPRAVEAIMQHVSDFYYELATRFFEAAGDKLDIFFFGDDMGTQLSLIVNPEAWRALCKPHVRRFARLGRQADMKVMFHSCGAVREIIPDLIESGIDALNPVQSRAQGMALEGLKRDFGDRLTFHGAVDHQHVLPRGTPEEVRAEVRRVIDSMGPGGGYCLAPSHDLILAEFPPENVVAMYDEAFAYGQYG